MKCTFVDLADDGSAPVAIDSLSQIETLFRSYRAREPRFVQLSTDGGRELTVGVGPEVGSVQFHAEGDPEPYWMAVATGNGEARGDTEFLAGNEPTVVPGQFVIPFADVLRIVAHFSNHGERHPEFAWEPL